SSARALPAIAEAVEGDLTILADSGVRSGLDVVRLLALGADGVLLGRAFVHALAAAGEQGVAHVLDLIASEMKVAMTLTGARAVGEISRESLVRGGSEIGVRIFWGCSVEAYKMLLLYSRVMGVVPLGL
ncbi:alpha-hydroxy-acid oxidizing protein, partial [Alloalcanivorax marinus]|uniref:alpha-hydroxy-acid oxidizing protein n=1 Tax=Alloalcanivorax marinus TaxID=1177169 RepID=UPI0021CE3061|nr:L-lactate dehydrogenase [Alloalcanivorax marinus]